MQRSAAISAALSMWVVEIVSGTSVSMPATFRAGAMRSTPCLATLRARKPIRDSPAIGGSLNGNRRHASFEDVRPARISSRRLKPRPLA
ncbi:MAG: hypothetical protein C3F11_09385 [Methylocystaceae bacterium]|nr:MAG: hypothetical protein C3F11_09385 [Methylocystaceae bacterium]